MIEAIFGGIIAIILSMIANVLTPFFQDFFKIKPVTVPDIPERQAPELEPSNVEEWRTQNRAKLEAIVGKVYFYGFSYFAMYMAFFIPLSLNGGLVEPTVNLINSKLAIGYVINQDNLSTICAIFGVLAYAPFWRVSQLIASFISSIVVQFTFVNEIKYLAFTVLAMIFWAFFIAGNVSWVLNADAGWFDSIKFSLILWFLLFFFALANRR
ncbi:hypothetical protein MC64_020920 [Aeromonas caviae]|uniref:hypothetical protein n=1 Tax=Aeromonas TaxID=642 RepID=UPI000537C11F|nr:hypothetical protein [Aeromonas caviae]PNO57725.1 hypothetical protein MC64_020920 [Aeromonas caviae]QUM00786.1 hypothetical protein IMO17_16620 [Aeromonas caviae]